MKRLFAVAVAVTALGAGAAAQEDITITGWWSPGKAQACQEAFDDLAAAGFTATQIPTWQMNVDEIKQLLDFCVAPKLRGALYIAAEEYAAADHMTKIETWVNAVKDHPQFSGYMLCDEPDMDKLDTLANVSERIRQLDPHHPVFVNFLPAYAWEPYEEHIEEYVTALRPNMLSYDCYVLYADSEDMTRYFDNLRRIRALAHKHSLPFTNIFLLIPHGGYRDPSAADLRWQVYTSLAYGAKGLCYFTYMTPPPNDPNYSGWGKGIVYWDGKHTDKYNIVEGINNEIHKLAPVLASLHSTAVYHSPPIPEISEPLPPDGSIVGIEGGSFVVGCFEAENGEQYALVVNRNMRTKADAKMVMREKTPVELIKSSKKKRKPLRLRQEEDYWTCSLPLRPGEGRLIAIGNAFEK